MRKATLRKLLKPQQTKWWGSVYDFQPVLLEKTWGDGNQLVQLFPINERPRYWVVRVDSKCDSDSEAWYEILDDIYNAIDEQFGSPSEKDLGVGDERPYFPMFDWEGCSWHFVRESRRA